MTRLTPTTDPGKQPDLAVVVPAWNERENIELLLPALKEMIADLGLKAEIIVADGGALYGTGAPGQAGGRHGGVPEGPGLGPPPQPALCRSPPPRHQPTAAALFPRPRCPGV